MRKFRASMEPFWDLKIGKYVEYLTPVSSEYIKSWELLSPTSTAGRTSRVLLADIIPWLNKASLVLYIVARMLCTMPWPTWCSEAVLRCRVHLLWLKHRNLSLSRSRVGLRFHLCCNWGTGIDVACRPCTHYIDNLYHIMHHNNYAATGDVVKFFILFSFIVGMNDHLCWTIFQRDVKLWNGTVNCFVWISL